MVKNGAQFGIQHEQVEIYSQGAARGRGQWIKKKLLRENVRGKEDSF